jgi:MoaD family protein
MTVKYCSEIRRFTARNQEQRAKAAATVRALLEELADEYGAAFANRVFKSGCLSDTVLVFVNGRDVAHLSGLDTRLSAEDVVVISPVVPVCG